MANLLLPGDQAPWFHAPALSGNPRYAFDTAAGRLILMLFAGPAAHPALAPALRLLAEHRGLFDDRYACFFGVSTDPHDVLEGTVEQQLPGIRWFLDHDGAVSRLYGALDDGMSETNYRPHWLLLDPTLRVCGRFPISAGDQAIAALQAQIAAPDIYSAAPVLVVPRVFEPALCRRLIELYEAKGGEDSGFMREENGLTVERVDHHHKRRSDYHIEDDSLREQLRARLARFLLPQIKRALGWQATRIERWMVACYDGDNGGGHFRAHRDNTTKGTAHRKFACTINLNAGEYDGGDLCFPEFGPATYRAPTGGAVIFSCSLLHEAQPVTRGKRYAFLPFLYDEDGARLRETNLQFLAASATSQPQPTITTDAPA
ncbi:PKHD-type hydroxylase YbiX [Sphingomonas mucosissima]|uniref:PKHD-type hydroxylase YbiX n=2 Tax=Sphingomonas mucosissima TaxID=370959 RepID=A0A245ZG57_9SPHN|nr:PKHD-type hydroxylase YbiX [Sphingomonas mucosissima]